jgi:hypothetical protein
MPASSFETRMAHLEGAYDQVSQRLMNIDPRFDGVDRKIDLRFDALDKKIDHRFDALDAKVDKRFTWTIGVVITTWLTTIASIYLRH